MSTGDLPHRTTPFRRLDFGHPDLARLAADRGWVGWPPPGRIGAVRAFVRDDIRSGCNASDGLPASRVLAEGIGRCSAGSADGA
jgi:hypothetical protein